MESKQHYLKRREKQLHDWDREIAALRAKAKAAAPEAAARSAPLFKELTTVRNHAWMHLDTLKGAATNAWGERFDYVWGSIQDKVETAVEALSKKLEEVRAAVG